MDISEIKLLPQSPVAIATVSHGHVILHDAQDALELLMHCCYHLDTNRLLLSAHHLVPEFFDLSSGIAGEILQKFSNYDGYLAIVGDFSHPTSNSLRDFIRESNRRGRISFVADQETGIRVLGGRQQGV